MKKIILTIFVVLSLVGNAAAFMFPPMYGAVPDTSDVTLTGTTSVQTLTVQDGYTTTLDGPVVVGESLGPELVVDGGFADTANWTEGTGWSLATGAAVHTGGTAGTLVPTVALTPTIGTTYAISYTLTAPDTRSISVAFGGITGVSGDATSGTKTIYITAGTTGNLTITPTTAGTTVTVDNVSIKAVTSYLTPSAGPVVVQKTMSSATANETVMKVRGVQTGAAGDKTVLGLYYPGTAGGGSEFLLEGYNGASRTFSLTASGIINLSSSVIAAGFSGYGSNAPGTTGIFTTSALLSNAANAAYTFMGKPAIHSAGTDLEAFRAAPDLSNDHTGGNFYAFSAPTLTSADAQINKAVVSAGTGWDYIVQSANFSVTGAGNINTAGPATFTVPNAAGGSNTAITVNPTLGIMDNSDTWTGISIAPTNADHTGTGNTVNGISIGNITGDAEAIENAISIGTGYDRGINFSGAGSVLSASNITITPSSATTESSIRLGTDFTGSSFFAFVQSSSGVELTGTAVQDFVSVKPEIAQSGAGGYNAMHILVGEPTPYTGGGGSGAQSLILAETGHEDFSSPIEKFRVSRDGTLTSNAQVKKLAFTKTSLTNNSAVDIFTITLAAGEIVTGHLAYGINSTGGTSDLQAHSGMVTFACANKGGTFTTDIDEVYLAASETQVLTAGTQADTWAMKAGNVCTVTLNVNSNLSSAVNSVSGEIVLNSVKTITLN